MPVLVTLEDVSWIAVVVESEVGYVAVGTNKFIDVVLYNTTVFSILNVIVFVGGQTVGTATFHYEIVRMVDVDLSQFVDGRRRVSVSKFVEIDEGDTVLDTGAGIGIEFYAFAVGDHRFKGQVEGIGRRHIFEIGAGVFVAIDSLYARFEAAVQTCRGSLERYG